MANTPRFLRIRTGAGWHGAFQAANGEKVWTTEVYPSPYSVVGAIDSLARTILGAGASLNWSKTAGVLTFNGHEVPLVDVDERTDTTSEVRTLGGDVIEFETPASGESLNHPLNCICVRCETTASTSERYPGDH